MVEKTAKRKRSRKQLKIQIQPKTENETDQPTIHSGNNMSQNGVAKSKLKPNIQIKHLFEKAYDSDNYNNEMETETTTDIQSSGFQIKKLWLGNFEMNVWYSAPYPEEYCKSNQLFMCEFCLKYMKSSYICYRHMIKCKVRNPPGEEIYREKNLSVFEVDGRKNRIYCQNLCLLAKMFLDHKTLYYDVEPFLFYILTEVDKKGCHLVGYFSKEKRSTSGNNLSCILTLPNHQRKGYGSFLIDISYLLSKKENKLGSPEKPLSNLGLLGYRSYWKNQIYQEILSLKSSKNFTLESLCYRLGMNPDDVVSTLFINGMMEEVDGKFVLNLDLKKIEAHVQKMKLKNPLSAKAEHLRWSPFVNKLVPTAPTSSTASSASSSTNSSDHEDS